jgi:thioredoxin-dependent peroxiredoxin
MAVAPKKPAKKTAATPAARSAAVSAPSKLPAKGRMAPDFTLHTDEGVPLKLSSLRGKVVVLFFYPKDNTPTCTKEACDLRDAFPQFNNIDAVVLGISPDTVQQHVKFRKKFLLPYNLLADTEHAVAQKYGVWAQKTLFGYKYMGILRTTFLIDERGKIAEVFENVKANGHAAELLAAIAAHRKRKT